MLQEYIYENSIKTIHLEGTELENISAIRNWIKLIKFILYIQKWNTKDVLNYMK